MCMNVILFFLLLLYYIYINCARITRETVLFTLQTNGPRKLLLLNYARGLVYVKVVVVVVVVGETLTRGRFVLQGQKPNYFPNYRFVTRSCATLGISSTKQKESEREREDTLSRRLYLYNIFIRQIDRGGSTRDDEVIIKPD